MTRARERLFLTAALSRRLYNNDSYNMPSRFLDEVPTHLVQRWNGFGTRQGSGVRVRLGARGQGVWQEFRAPSPESRVPRREVLEPFVDHLQVGMRVRHPEWGVGTIKERIGEGDDLKVIITFAGVGRKKLAASFVHLDRA